MKKIYAFMLSALLIAAALVFAGCTVVFEKKSDVTVNPEYVPAINQEETTDAKTEAFYFTFTLSHDGSEQTYGINSEYENLGRAMGGLIAGKFEGDSFKTLTVNGIEATDGYVWCFYKNGVLQTEDAAHITVAEGDEIKAILEKGE